MNGREMFEQETNVVNIAEWLGRTWVGVGLNSNYRTVVK